MNDLFRSAMLGDLKTLVEAGSESALHVSDEKGDHLTLRRCDVRQSGYIGILERRWSKRQRAADGWRASLDLRVE